MLWEIFCWEALDPAIHADFTLTCTAYLSTVMDHEHPFMETVLPDRFGLFHHNNVPCHKTEMAQE